MGSDPNIEALDEGRSRLFILGDDGKMSNLRESKELDEKFSTIETFSFSRSEFYGNPWNKLCLQKGAYTYGKKIYKAETSIEMPSSKEGLEWFSKTSETEGYDLNVQQLRGSAAMIAFEKYPLAQEKN